MSSSFAQLAFGVAGGIIGAPFGLSAVGFAIGSGLAGAFFAPDGPTVEGPRLGDLDVTASTLGVVIPEHYGVTRTSGNVIWSAGLKESKESKKSGGKGGGGGKQTSYTYSTSFAVALGYGEASELLRIWADGKLIYDVTGLGDVQEGEYKFTFKRGTATQTTDRLIEESINRRLAGMPDLNEGNGEQADFRTIAELIDEADTLVLAGDTGRAQLYKDALTARKTAVEAGLGVNEVPDYRFTPAYRNVAYIRFDDMPLANFGNRIPNITCEVAWRDAYTSSSVFTTDDGGLTETTLTETAGDTSVPTTSATSPTGRDLLAISGTTLRRFNAGTGGEVSFRSTTETGKGILEEVLAVSDRGYALSRFSNIAVSQYTLARVAVAGLGFTGISTFNAMAAEVVDIQHAAYIGNDFFVGINSSGYFFTLESKSNETTVLSGYDDTGAGITYDALGGTGPLCRGPDDKVYVLATVGTDWNLIEVKVNAVESTQDVGTYVDGTPSYAYVSWAVKESAALGGETIAGVFYDSTSNRIYGLFANGTTSGRLIAFNENGDIQYNVVLSVAPPAASSGLTDSYIGGGSLAYAREDDLVGIDLPTGEEVVHIAGLTANSSTAVQVYDSSAGTLIAWVNGVPTKIKIKSLSSSRDYARTGTIGIDDIISDICTRAGMTADEFDVSDLAGNEGVIGFSLSRPVTGRSAMDNLLLTQFIDGVESDWKVRFKPRASTPVVTLTEDDLGSIDSEGGPVDWLESRQGEYELPRELTLRFPDINRDFQQNATPRTRPLEPTPTMYAVKKESLELTVVMNEVSAVTVVDRLLYLTWLARVSGKTRLPWKYTYLDATDPVAVAFDDGTTIVHRVEKSLLGANYEIELETKRTADDIYTKVDVIGLDTGAIPVVSIPTEYPAYLFVLDIPLLYDYHTTNRSALRFYTTAYSDTTSFRGAQVFSSIDDTNFVSYSDAPIDATWGTVVGTVAAPPALWTMDNTTTITVSVAVDNGDIASTTFDDILNNNANRAVLLNKDTGEAEIIQFQNATDNGDGTYTLDTLVRGLQGTDYIVGLLGENPTFILLNDSSTLPQVRELSKIGSTEYHRAVPYSGLIGAAQTTEITYAGRALMPWAPSNVARSDDGTDLTITWNRRVRLGGAWSHYAGAPEDLPLYEDTEAYEVYLVALAGSLDAFDPTDASTYSAKHSEVVESTVFTAAEIAAAGYTLTDAFKVVVYQLSAQVGRGFPRAETLYL